MKARNRLKLQTILATAIIVVALIYALFIRPNYYKMNGGKIYFEPVFSENIQVTGNSQFCTYDGSIFRASVNGLKKMSSKGVNIWDKTFYILNPKLYTNNQYMAVVDITGKEAYMFDENGSLVDIKTEYPILFGSITSEGALVLVEEMEGKHLIQLYNRKGILAAERMTVFEDDGYPIGIALSSSGEIMVTSYLTMNHGNMQTNITFFSFGEAGENDSEHILAFFSLENTLAPEVHFMDDQHISVAGDRSITFYSLTNTKPKMVKQIELTNKITSLDYDEKNIILNLGQAITLSDISLDGTIVSYNKEGQNKEKYKLKEPILNLIGEKNGYYLITKDGIAYYLSGKKLWENDNYKEAIDIQKINKEAYLIVYPSSYEVVKIKDI